MTNRMFFVITGNDDGEAYIKKLDEAGVLAFIEEEKDYSEPRKYISDVTGLQNICELDGTIIIEGKIVMPRAAQVTTKWEI